MPERAVKATTGPYIITTSHTPEHDGATGYVISRRAVATLEEAIKAAQDACGTDLMGRLEASLMPETGGWLAHPDGTTIKVEPRQWYELAQDVGWHPDQDAHRGEAELVAAWNAKQGERG